MYVEQGGGLTSFTHSLVTSPGSLRKIAGAAQRMLLRRVGVVVTAFQRSFSCCHADRRFQFFSLGRASIFPRAYLVFFHRRNNRGGAMIHLRWHVCKSDVFLMHGGHSMYSVRREIVLFCIF